MSLEERLESLQREKLNNEIISKTLQKLKLMQQDIADGLLAFHGNYYSLTEIDHYVRTNLQHLSKCKCYKLQTNENTDGIIDLPCKVLSRLYYDCGDRYMRNPPCEKGYLSIEKLPIRRVYDINELVEYYTLVYNQKIENIKVLTNKANFAIRELNLYYLKRLGLELGNIPNEK